MSDSRLGVCRICGVNERLSFEHVPPRSAFNDRAVILVDFLKALEQFPDSPSPKGKIQQRGAGGYTLCGQCNSVTGGWYGSRFADWCHQAAALLMASGGKPTLSHPYYIYPLAILKQIMTMFFSVNSDHFRTIHPSLVEFVLNKERRYLAPRYRFFVYYNVEGSFRYQGISAHLNMKDGQFRTLSEITFPPFGYVLSLDSHPPSNKLFEITHFARYDYDDFRVMQLQLPILPTHLPLPGDYRSSDEIHEQLRRSENHARGHGDP